MIFSSFRRIDNKLPTGKGRFCFFVCKWVKGLLNRTFYFSEFIILARTKSPSVEGGTGTLSWLSLLMSLLKTHCLKDGTSPPGKSDLGCLRCPLHCHLELHRGHLLPRQTTQSLCQPPQASVLFPSQDAFPWKLLIFAYTATVAFSVNKVFEGAAVGGNP